MAPFSLEQSAEIIFSGIPLPPSSNNMYRNARFGGRTKSLDFRIWERDFASWALENAQVLNRARELLKSRLKPGKVLAMHPTFFFERSRILSKSGKPKRNDTSNYLKALHDALAAILHVDDCWIFDGMMRKRPVENADTDEMVVVELEVLEAPWAMRVET